MNALDALARQGLEDAGTKLGGYIGRQRWFAGRDADVARTTIEDVIVVRSGGAAKRTDDDPPVISVIARVEMEDGASDRYHVPLAAREDASTVWEGNVIGSGRRDGRPVVFYDALSDGAASWAFWEAMAAGATLGGERGEVAVRDLGLDLTDGGGAAIRPLGREQSNTSVVRAEREVLKVFRRLVEGLTPEVEMVEALARAGFTSVAAPLGLMEYREEGREPVLLAMVQPYLSGGTEGWALALTSLRDLLAAAAETDGMPDGDAEASVLGQGSSFIPEAERIGTLTARMHLALAADSSPALRAEPVGPETLRAWAAEMRAELDHLLDTRADAVEPLLTVRAAVQTAFDELAALPEGGLAIRHHGDYHLGQLLRTNSGWTVLDFEGEPDRDVEARRMRSSPLRDVAGMMRSFDYAAAVELRDWTSPERPDFALLSGLADAWSRLNRDAFWGAYRSTVEGSPLLPQGDGASVMLRAFQLHKAVYEVGYELGHRPDWAGIPIRFLTAAGQGERRQP